MLACLILVALGADFSNQKIERLIESTFAIEKKVDNEWVFVGTGTAIKNKQKHYILTANHVIDLKEHYRACNIHEECSNISSFVYGMDQLDDWHILSLETQDVALSFLKIKNQEPTIGRKAHTQGLPGGKPMYQNAFLSSEFEINKDAVFLYDMIVSPGSSGSAIVDYKSNKITHLVVGGIFDYGQNYSNLTIATDLPHSIRLSF